MIYIDSVIRLRKYSVAFLLMGLNVITAAFFTSIEKPMFSFPISIGRGLMFPIFAVAVVPYLVGKENLWYTSAVSEGMVLTVFFVTRYLKWKG
jgi:Na+-driven multidrug efflux pump